MNTQCIELSWLKTFPPGTYGRVFNFRRKMENAWKENHFQQMKTFSLHPRKLSRKKIKLYLKIGYRLGWQILLWTAINLPQVSFTIPNKHTFQNILSETLICTYISRSCGVISQIKRINKKRIKRNRRNPTIVRKPIYDKL